MRKRHKTRKREKRKRALTSERIAERTPAKTISQELPKVSADETPRVPADYCNPEEKTVAQTVRRSPYTLVAGITALYMTDACPSLNWAVILVGTISLMLSLPECKFSKLALSACTISLVDIVVAILPMALASVSSTA